MSNYHPIIYFKFQLFYKPVSVGSKDISIDVAEELEVKALDEDSLDLLSDDFLDVKAS